VNLPFPTINANTVPPGIVDNMMPELPESDQTVSIPDQHYAFPGYALMLPAVLDEIIHLLAAEGAALIHVDASHGDVLVELARAGWNQWTGNRFRPRGGMVQLLNSAGQIELDHGNQPILPMALINQSPSTQYLAFTPIAVHGHEIGALWLGRDRKMTASEMLMLKSMGDVLADVMFCLSKEHQKDIDPLDVVQALVRLLAAWDVPTFQHSVRLVSWARAIARHVGCTESEIQTIGWAALLHDIGKVGIPKAILHKPGALTDEEWKVIKLHPKIGAKLLEPAAQLNLLKEIILSHHEKLDGSGYPMGLKGMEIPLGARIIAVVDAYGAMTEERVYRPQFTHEQAVAEIRRCEGTHFDSQISEAFLAQFH
jgi:putative nucleotidyltransferase with HDIG domain